MNPLKLCHIAVPCRGTCSSTGCEAQQTEGQAHSPPSQAPPAAPEAAPAGPPNPVFDSLRKFGAFAATALDFGSGRERGTVEAERKTGLEKELERRLREKVEKLKD